MRILFQYQHHHANVLIYVVWVLDWLKKIHTKWMCLKLAASVVFFSCYKLLLYGYEPASICAHIDAALRSRIFVIITQTMNVNAQLRLLYLNVW